MDADEYASRQMVYNRQLNGLLFWETEDTGLYEKITREKIRSQFAEIGFAASFLEALDDPRELQLAYDMVRKHPSHAEEMK